KIDNKSDIQNFGRIVPIYPGNKALSKARISSKLVLQWQKAILDKVKPPEFLPEELLQDHNLPLRPRAYRLNHLPESASEYQQSFKRSKFEELFLFELSVSKTKHDVSKQRRGHLFQNLSEYTPPFFNAQLPFELTNGQKSALADIKRDVQSS